MLELVMAPVTERFVFRMLASAQVVCSTFVGPEGKRREFSPFV